jgi:hypothetical protein
VGEIQKKMKQKNKEGENEMNRRKEHTVKENGGVKEGREKKEK